MKFGEGVNPHTHTDFQNTITSQLMAIPNSFSDYIDISDVAEQAYLVS